MATSLPADLELTLLDGESKPLPALLTTFHLASVVLDPYTNQSSWVLDPATRVLDQLAGAGVRVNWIVTSDADGARTFLGPLADRYLTFCDPDRAFVKAAGLQTLPAFLLVQQNLTIPVQAEGWNPAEWREVGAYIANLVRWTKPQVPSAGDPAAFHGTPALG
jgi:hypothetical protein